MRTFPTGRRLAVCGLTVLAGLLMAASVRPAVAAEGVARASDGKANIVGVSHSDPCVMEPVPDRNYSPRGTCSKGCGPGCQCGIACQCNGGCNGNEACGNGACGSNSSCKNGSCGKGGLCGKCGSGCNGGSGCRCGSGCECGKCGSGLGKLFGGDKGKNCRCGSGCQCGKGGGLRLCGGSGCKACCDLNGDGYADPIGNGVCKGCGAHGSLFGHGYCGHCCGGPGICLPGVPCLGGGLGIPCLGLPCLGGGCLGGGLAGLGTRPRGAIGGRYSRVYAVNPYYHDFRDGAVYAAQGYNAPVAVPLAPNVDYQYNYGWGIPSSRLTPVSRVVPSPYGPQPQYAVPYGYVPAGGTPVEAAATEAETTTDGETDPTP